jgi:bacillopeptidase F (M6 metalloprotease family)
MADYLIPTGANIEGSPMHAHWTNYKRLAELYVAGNEDTFMFVSYKSQQSYNEEEIQKECDRIGEGMKNLYRQAYNQAITQFRKTHDSSDLENALGYLEDFKNENEDDGTGTLVAEECSRCGEEAGIGELCADCYWSEDSYLKRMRRNAL